MADDPPRLYLVTPLVSDPEAIRQPLAEACAAAEIAAVLLRLADGGEDALVAAVKALAPVVQAEGAALILSVAGDADLAGIAIRGGADGVHAAGVGALRELRRRLGGDRILGIGGLRSKDDAMAAGEAGADYLMFGDPRPDGYVPALGDVAERAGWWAEIFETPSVAYAPSLAAIPLLAATGIEFVAVGGAIWDAEGGVARQVEAARRALAAASAEAVG